MLSIENGAKPDNRIMTKMMFTLLIITVMPLIIACAVYSNDPDSQLLKSIYAMTYHLPVLHSANNPLLSTVMNAWCKTAPLWGIVLFILAYKHLQIKGGQPASSMIKGLMLFSILYFPIIYMLLLHSTEMTSSGKFFRLMSENDYLLSSLFIMIYAVCYLYTVFYLFFAAATLKAIFRKRQINL